MHFLSHWSTWLLLLPLSRNPLYPPPPIRTHAFSSPLARLDARAWMYARWGGSLHSSSSWHPLSTAENSHPSALYTHDLTERTLLVLFVKSAFWLWSLPLVFSYSYINISVPQWNLQFCHLVLVRFLFSGTKDHLAGLFRGDFVYLCSDFIPCCSKGLTQQA